MQVIAVDESEKKAWRRSRRILGRHLYRLGSRTFVGRIDAESVQALATELRQAASKNTAVVLYRVGPGARPELIARIGNTRGWSEEGYFAHRVRRALASHDTQARYAPVQTLIRLLTRLAALFHDLGKVNRAFNLKLRGRSGHAGERLRHEMLSFLMLHAWTADDSDEAFLERLGSRAHSLGGLVRADHTLAVDAALAQQVLTAPTLDLTQTEAFARLAKAVGGDESLRRTPLKHAVWWLVLTHHRLLGAQQAGAPSLHEHVNPQVPAGENLVCMHRQRPWEDQAWLAAVRDCARSLQRLLADHPQLLEQLRAHPAAWVHNVALVARPTLIGADHVATLQKQATEVPDPDAAYANTVSADNGKRTALADPLPLHLRRARQAVDPVFRLGEMGDALALPAIEVASLPATSLLRQDAAPDSPFHWQTEAAQTVGGVADLHRRPFFAAVVSATSAGKTVGGAKLLAAASGGALRYTCAFGQKSLTLQTGAAYRQALSLPEQACITVVGDALYVKLAADTDGAVGGSDVLRDEDELLTDAGVPAPQAVARVLNVDLAAAAAAVFGSAKRLAMVSAPVVVCTVDHLMRVPALETGSDAKMALRLRSADLLLDEVDAYSNEDLTALGRLVFTAGVYGRRVVLMSATVSETALAALYEAWCTGLAAWRLRTGRTEAAVLALVSDRQKTAVHENADASQGKAAIEAFITGVIAATPPADARNRLQVLPLGSTVASAYDALHAATQRLAATFSTTDPATGKTLSVGFVRFNQVRRAREFARHLFAAGVPTGTSLKVQCYHRRYPVLVLSLIERELNALLLRKDPLAVFNHPLIRRWMHDEQPQAQHYVLVVSTTSLQETGRDHDYDWAIVEPWSSRSVVQSAGRVRRHRPFRTDAPNILLMETLLADLDPKQAGRYPLAIAADAALPVKDALLQAVSSPYALLKHFADNKRPLPASVTTKRASWLPVQDWAQGLTAAPCQRKPAGTAAEAAPLTAIEHYAQALRLSGSSPARCEPWSLSALLADPCALLNHRHARDIRFRRQQGEQETLAFDPAAGYRSLAVVQRVPGAGLQLHPLPSANGGLFACAVDNPQRAFVPLHTLTAAHVEAELTRAGAARDERKLALSFELRGDFAELITGRTSVDYDVLLGAARARG